MNILAEEKNVHRLAYAVCRSVDVSVAQCMDAAKDALRLGLNAILSSPGKDGGQEVEEVAAMVQRYMIAAGIGEEKAAAVTLLLERTGLLASPQPASTALVERLKERGQAFANQVRLITHLLHGQAYSTTVAELNAFDAALSASTSRQGER